MNEPQTLVHDQLIVGCSDGSIQTFARTDAGAAMSTTAISDVGSVVLDPASGQIFAADTANARIEVFARTATGNSVPDHVITGSATSLASYSSPTARR